METAHYRRPRRLPVSALLALCIGLVLAIYGSTLAVETAAHVDEIAEHAGIETSLAATVADIVDEPEADAATKECWRWSCKVYLTAAETRYAAAQVADLLNHHDVAIWTLGCAAAAVLAGFVAGAISAALLYYGGIAVGIAVGAVTFLGCGAVKWRLASIVHTLEQAAEEGGCFTMKVSRWGSTHPFAARSWGYTTNPHHCTPGSFT